MQPELAVPGAFLLAALIAFAATPLAVRVARATSFFDMPAGYKGHRRPTPYLGGAAVMAAVLGAAFAFRGDGGGLGLILGVAAILWLLGTVDDRVSLPLPPRVLVEVGAAALLWATGHGWSALGWAPADLALTVVWVVGVMNAFNLMDNMDGAAATTITISAAGAGALALVVGDVHLAVLAFALAGACAGFLPHNLAKPARIFMGDGGSLPAGFLVASVVMAAAARNSPGLSAVIVAALLVGLVVLDTSLVTVSRLRGGRQVLLGGSDHLTHRIVKRLGSPRRVALGLGAAQLVLCAVTVAVAAVNVLWILMLGSVAATLGVLLIWTLESAPWLERRDEAALVDPSLATSRAANAAPIPAGGVSIVAAAVHGPEADARAGQPGAGRPL
jgi:UDP-GlcNAc:undecaprenyl-phosphate GlcNAc-1-phosphate transferase